MIYQKLEETSKIVFEKINFKIHNLHIEKESKDYAACQFELNNLKIIFREAKTTPTKIGQFVTLWKRIDHNPIEPFSESDDFDFVIINTKIASSFGQFIFPKQILIDKAYLQSSTKKGKLAFRVYPSWDITTNKQAQKTQKWQLDYFIETPLNIDKAKSLLAKNQ